MATAALVCFQTASRLERKLFHRHQLVVVAVWTSQCCHPLVCSPTHLLFATSPLFALFFIVGADANHQPGRRS